ncbi:MAG: hypothetical protein A2288_00575 [Candidatus Moranbacteria bacterium RIFOXYA12_FULL_44_15]|nr:MAG: hypothetical protein A2288_00575 [Candidatus Moranbacteria bacterium RIFOXYA12_FULL_44_15]OGI35428.1 MAG: hypothetical protein A2259_00040 [Candidatus Moranbacteria bacterium RIFOXYA2_FULL_43_15]
MAENQQDNDDGKKKDKKGFWAKIIYENAQNIGIAIAVAIGLLKDRPEAQTIGAGDKEFDKQKLSNLLPDEFTLQDEIEFGGVVDSHPDQSLKAVERVFRETFKKRGYREGRYREILIGYNRDFINKVNNPPPEDKSKGRIQYAQMTVENSALKFFDQLLEEYNAGGAPEEIYLRQERWAKSRDLLTESGVIRTTVQTVHNHPVATVASLPPLAIVLVCSVILLILLTIFGLPSIWVKLYQFYSHLL